MGVAYYIVLDNPAPGFDTMVNGKAIARHAEVINNLADQLGLKIIDDYYNISAEDAGEFLDEDSEGLDHLVEEFFPSQEGLEWTAKLIAAVSASADKNREAILRDLRQYEAVFTKAKAIGAKWHFAIDL